MKGHKPTGPIPLVPVKNNSNFNFSKDSFSRIKIVQQQSVVYRVYDLEECGQQALQPSNGFKYTSF